MSGVTPSLPGHSWVVVPGWGFVCASGSYVLREGLVRFTANRVQRRLGFCFYPHCFLLEVLVSPVSFFQLVECDDPELANNELE